MTKVAVITGGSAGVGRATAEAFARRGCHVGLIARDQGRLDEAAADLARYGVRVCAVSADVGDAAAIDAAADQIAGELGPIDIWVNNAMATVFGPVAAIDAAEFQRATMTTYLGAVHGTMAALRHMRERGRGTIVNVGSALAYRSVPLQSAYCGAKHAIMGFTDSLRSELMHDRSRVHVTMVHLSAINTPQFSWAMNKMGRRPQPIAPVYQPEVAARAIVFAAFNRRREVWVGWPTIRAIMANKIAPGLLDVYLACFGYRGQLTAEKAEPSAGNLFQPVPGDFGAHGRFDKQADGSSTALMTSRQRAGIMAGALLIGSIGLNRWLKRRLHPRPRG